MSASLTNVLPMLKEHYQQDITEIFFTSDKSTCPILTNMEEKSMAEEGYGRGFVVPVAYGMGSSVSADFATAQAISQDTTSGSRVSRDRWIVQAAKIEMTAQWDRDAMLGAQGDDELFDVMKQEIDAKIGRVRQRLAHAAAEGGWGLIGTLSAVAATSLTFNSTSIINRLSVGDHLVAAAAEGTGALLTYGGTGIAKVATIDPDTGVVGITLVNDGAIDVTAGAGQAWTATSRIFFRGDRNTGATMIMPAGLKGWIAGSAGGTWMNIARTGIPELCGHTINASTGGWDHSTSLIQAANRLYQYNSAADVIYVSGPDYATLCADKDATKVVEIKLGKYEISFSGVSIQTLSGNVPVVPDAMLAQGTAYAGPFGNKKFAPYLAHNGELVNIDDLDGNQITRLAASTAFELRGYFRGNFICPAPGKFAVITNLPT